MNETPKEKLPVWFMRTTPASYLRKIAKLRKQHTANFLAEKWLANQTADRKIRENWEAFNKLSTKYRANGTTCFLCGKETASPIVTGLERGKETAAPIEDSPWEVFCSRDHAEQFGILKGTT